MKELLAIMMCLATANSLLGYVLAEFSGNPNAAMEQLASSTNLWGVDSSRLSAVFEGSYGALNYGFPQECQTNIPTVFCAFADADFPIDATIDGTNTWLNVRCDIVLGLMGSDFVRNDTNCWLALARDYGRLHALGSKDWFEFLGLDSSLIVRNDDGSVIIQAPPEKRAVLNGLNWVTIGTDGVAIVNSPPGAGLELDVRDALNLKRKIEWSKQIDKRIFGVFASSRTFMLMSASEHNAIISNIVEAAHFTADEAASLGLTNVVDQVSE